MRYPEGLGPCQFKITQPNQVGSAPGGGTPGGSAGGDLGGTFPGPTVIAIQGIPVSSTAPTNGQELVYNSGTGQWEPTTEAAASGLPWSYAKADGGLVGDGTTDDTAACQAWITSVTASGTQSGWFWFEPGTYLIGGALQSTGTFNGQILLPNVSTASPQITLTFQGPARPPFSFHGSIANPSGYAIIRSTLTGASGTAAVFSGGNSGQNNIEVVVRDLVCDATANPTFTFWNLSTTQGGKRDGLFILPHNLWSNAITQPTNTNAYGIKLPQTNNSDLSAEDSIMVVGFYTGILHGELVVSNYILSLCAVAVEFPFMYHPGGNVKMVQTACPIGMLFTGGNNYVDIWYDAEHCNVGAGGPFNPAWAVSVYDLSDASNYFHGHVRWFGVQAGVGPDHIFTVNSATNALYEEIGQPPAGGGTVTSVALTVPTEFSVAGSPVTGAGTLAVTKANQSANLVYAGPTSGAAAAPAFRALVAADIPSGVSGATDHEHIMDVLMSGDGATLAFELPAAPFDAYSVAAYVAGVLTEITLSGAMLTTATFGAAPASATDNIRFDIVAAVA